MILNETMNKILIYSPIWKRVFNYWCQIKIVIIEFLQLKRPNKQFFTWTNESIQNVKGNQLIKRIIWIRSPSNEEIWIPNQQKENNLRWLEYRGEQNLPWIPHWELGWLQNWANEKKKPCVLQNF